MMPRSPNPRTPAGQVRPTRLAQATVAALRYRELADEIALVQSRVFVRSVDELFETDPEDDRGSLRFKPMLELLLLHIRDVAAQDARPLDERQRDIRWAIDAAGF